MTSFTPTTLNYPQLADTAIRRVKATRNPTSTDRHNFHLGDEWLNTVAQLWWKLAGVTNAAATWVAMTGSGSSVLTINNVPATMNNITLAVTSPITVSNNVGTSTITIGTLGTVPTTFHTNSGDAIPSGNAITVTGVAGISTAGAGSTITISGSGSSLSWHVITANQALASNNGYICTSGSLNLSLPLTSALGDIIVVAMNGATSFTISQAAGQQVRVSGSQTTSGASGSITSTGTGDSITLVCQTANTVWVALSYDGNLTVT